MKKLLNDKILLVLLSLMAVFFYDITLPIVYRVIELKINILGAFLEPFLQWAFGISLRKSQIVSAWIYIVLASLLVWYLLYKGYQALCHIFHAARYSWLTKNRWQKIRLLLLILLIFIVIGKILLLFI